MNKKHLRNSAVLIIILELILIGIGNFTEIVIPPAVYIVAALLGILSFVLGEWISGAINERPALYVNRYMMSFMIKMMSFLGFLAIYLYLNRENKVSVAVSLLSCYLVFTVSMIIFLKKEEKRNHLKNPTPKKSNL